MNNDDKLKIPIFLYREVAGNKISIRLENNKLNPLILPNTHSNTLNTLRSFIRVYKPPIHL